MNELIIAGKKYISSKRAAEITGYAKDYVGQLCREGYVEATMVGRSWYALEISIMEHRFGKEEHTKAALTAKIEEEALEVSTPFVQTNTPEPETPVYTREENINIPIVQKNEVKKEYLVSSNQYVGNTVVDMQSAWQEWFSKKQSTLIETPEVIDERNEKISDDALLMPIIPTEANNEIVTQNEVVEEPVAIRREFEPMKPLLPVLRPMQSEFETEPIEIHKIPSTNDQLSHRIVSHYKDENMQVPTHSSNKIVRSLLVAVSFIAVTVALIGSGVAEKYMASSRIQSNIIISVLEGKTYIVK